MSITIENILLIGSLLLFISILVGKTSYRFGVPTLVLFLSVGMLAGSEGFGKIEFENSQVAQFVGIIALNFILFSGGLDTRWSTIKPILGQGIMLSTFGVLITCVTTGVIVYIFTDFGLYEGLLLGAIVSSTDAAAVFSILRSKNLALKSNLRPTLELESGSNDPMAYFLTVAMLGMVQEPSGSLWNIVPMFFQQIALGVLLGFVFGYISRITINKIRLDFEGLYPVLVIALVFITFSATDFLGGNGFLAVYLCGLYLGNRNLIHKKTIVSMFDGLAWLMQIAMFLTLGLLVTPSKMIPVMGIGILVSLFLIFIARPVGVFISLAFFKMKLRRRLYISWVGLRGAVPIVFATYPLLAGIEKADLIFNIVFFVSLISVLMQGTTLSIVAHWLGVSRQQNETERLSVQELMDEHMKSIMKEIEIKSGNPFAEHAIVDIGFPKGTIIAMIMRKDKFFTPDGSTILKVGDILVVLAENKTSLNTVSDLFQDKH
ncbi:MULTISPECIES: potassium/proton antiporter [Sinomicrobium]|uniref:potassium/proton antiporter n=1 Tax=Sinomicrobium TaxID=1434045 RepID=UPI000DCE0D79|nr:MULTISPECIES: potassium/proton antiporter [Sinomicrobium]RAV29177.1 potassium/proton antiporter [Sinomicrobium sp. N-1-3-6]